MPAALFSRFLQDGRGSFTPAWILLPSEEAARWFLMFNTAPPQKTKKDPTTSTTNISTILQEKPAHTNLHPPARDSHQTASVRVFFESCRAKRV